jgi:hypothetical protein
LAALESSSSPPVRLDVMKEWAARLPCMKPADLSRVVYGALTHGHEVSGHVLLDSHDMVGVWNEHWKALYFGDGDVRAETLRLEHDLRAKLDGIRAPPNGEH